MNRLGQRLVALLGGLDERPKTVLALLIALASSLSAVAAWWASEALNAADDAERKGFSDSVARAQVRHEVLIGIERSVFEYELARIHELRAGALREGGLRTSGDAAARLLAEAAHEEALAAEQREDLGENIGRNGRLLLARMVKRELNSAAARQDLDSDRDFARSTELGEKALVLIGLMASLIAAAFFFTIAEFWAAKRRQFLIGGLVLLVAAAVAIVGVEVRW